MWELTHIFQRGQNHQRNIFSLLGLWGKTCGQHFGPQEIGHVFQRLRALSEDVQRLVVVGAVTKVGWRSFI